MIDPPGTNVRRFLLILAWFRLSSRALGLIINQMRKNPNLSLLVAAASNCSVAKQFRRQVCSDPDRRELAEMQRTRDRSVCYGLGTALAHLSGKTPTPSSQNKKSRGSDK
jgi:hypothetical protein